MAGGLCSYDPNEHDWISCGDVIIIWRESNADWALSALIRDPDLRPAESFSSVSELQIAPTLASSCNRKCRIHLHKQAAASERGRVGNACDSLRICLLVALGKGSRDRSVTDKTVRKWMWCRAFPEASVFPCAR